MNRESIQQQFAIRESESRSGLIRGVAKLKDPIAERLRGTVLRLMKEHGITEQKELVERCASPFVRADQVHKLMKGDLQFPPLTFFDTVLRTLGSSLVEALEKEPAVRPLPIRRADVLDLARLLERRSPEYVASLKKVIAEMPPRARSRG